MKEDIRSILITLYLAPAFVPVLCSETDRLDLGLGGLETCPVRAAWPREEQSLVSIPKSLQC